MIRPAHLLIAALIVVCPPAQAADAPRYNQVRFEVERSQPIENDRMQAVLSITVEDESPTRLADEINRTMEWALKTAKAQPELTIQTGSYRTYPVYEKNKIVRWRAVQELALEGRDFARLGTLIGQLQARLQVISVNFTLSPERRRAVEDALTVQALDAFKQRSHLVRKQLAATRYRIVDVSISAGGGVPPPVPMLRADSFEPRSVAPPAFHAGTSTMTVNVSGVIELQ